jgi:hypothetical protein
VVGVAGRVVVREADAVLVVVIVTLLRVGHLGGVLSDAAHVPRDDLVDVFAEVVPDVPAIGHLHRGRSRVGGGLGVGAGPVTADHLDAAVRAQPVGEGVRLSVRWKVHRPVAGHVQQHRPVDVPAAQREVVH